MRTETTQTNIYKYEELTPEAQEQAQEQVKERIIEEDREPYIFTEDTKEDLKEHYKLDIDSLYYSLSYCQGDGVCFTGTFDILELLKSENFLEHVEQNYLSKFIKLYEQNKIDNIVISKTSHYYQHQNTTSIEIEELEEVTQEEEKHLAYLQFYFKSFYNNICEMIEKDGYTFFYEVTDDNIKDYIGWNEVEFLQDGSIYN